MPSKKKKYNARFPAGRIKKIMQTDEEVGKVAQAVPVIISKALEMFIESLLKKSMQITQSRNAKTLTPSHMKQCILSENRFDFLKDLVKNIPDASIQEDNENNALAESNDNFGIVPDELGSIERSLSPDVKENLTAPVANFYTEQSTSSTSRTPVIQFSPRVKQDSGSKAKPKSDKASLSQPKLHLSIASQELSSTQHIVPSSSTISHSSGNHSIIRMDGQETVPPLVPISKNAYLQSSSGDGLCIDEDYDN